MELAELDQVDFIDIGASAGGSLRWAQNTFGKVGLGIDLDPEKVAKTLKSGFRAVRADATDLEFPDNAVSFAIVTDFLEHLPSSEDAKKVIQNAARVARDFVYIAYPDFDNEDQLREQGLKRYYADWSGHTLHFHSSELTAVTSRLKADDQIFKLGEIFDSYDRAILPLSAPKNSSFYDPAIHDPKPHVVFPRKQFFTRNLCVIVKSDRYTMPELMVKILYSIGYMRRIRG